MPHQPASSALARFRVIDLTQVRAGPTAARQLAEGTFVERVLATVRQMELNPHQVTLDFDENTLLPQKIRRNGQVIATSQGYASKANALNGIESIKKNAPGAEVVEVEK